ncbi:MAG TPA: PleD family two-component system response regulator [Acetobacteraceae bacterium]|nr:PleD family two-component system response regulator [Acetobacteraceae bacterium]
MTSRILVIDDIVANARLLEVMLAAEYYDIQTKFSGPDAIEAAAAWQPDLILLDVMMPELDGYEVCRRLKAMPETSHIPVVLVTALNEPGERLRGLECGADDFFTKPVEHDVLMARVSGLVRFKRLLDEWGARRDIARNLGLMHEAIAESMLDAPQALVIDDSGTMMGEIRDILAQEGIRAVQAETELQALSMSADTSYDLLIVNLSVSFDDPLRLIAKLRAANSTHETPLLLVAEPYQQKLRVRGFELGANDCLILPLDSSELRVRARNQIRLKRYRDQLRADVGDALKLGAIDDLTGLYNIRFFKFRLKKMIEMSNHQTALLMIDIDKFKSINDCHGHSVGDEVLRIIGRHLSASVRNSDVIARYGGEEFAVIMPQSSKNDAAFVAERIRTTIEKAQYVVNVDDALRVTVSIGVAVTAPQQESMESLIERADAALYEAKRGGRNRIVFSEAMEKQQGEDRGV